MSSRSGIVGQRAYAFGNFFLDIVRLISIEKCESVSCSVVSDLCNPMDCSPPGSSVPGILQERILEWVAISFSRGSSQPRVQTQVSRIGGGCFTIWATREDLQIYLKTCLFCCSLFLPVSLCFHRYLFHLPNEHPLMFTLSQIYVNSLGFYLSESLFLFHLQSWRVFLLGVAF